MTPKEYFDTYREYRMAEHHQINSRITWSLTVQGFLFAAYGLLLTHLAELETKPALQVDDESIRRIKYLASLVPLFGLLLSVFVTASVFAAVLALWKLKTLWETRIRGEDLDGNLPAPHGGGSNLAMHLGYGAPLGIPILFLVVWLMLLVH